MIILVLDALLRLLDCCRLQVFFGKKREQTWLIIICDLIIASTYSFYSFLIWKVMFQSNVDLISVVRHYSVRSVRVTLQSFKPAILESNFLCFRIYSASSELLNIFCIYFNCQTNWQGKYKLCCVIVKSLTVSLTELQVPFPFCLGLCLVSR